MEVEAEWWSGSGGRLAEELDEEEVCILYIIKTILNILPLFLSLPQFVQKGY